MKEVEKISIRELEDWKEIKKNDSNLFEKVETVADKIKNEETDSKKINLIQEAFSSFSKEEKIAIGAGLLLFGVPMAIIAAALAIPVVILYGINSGVEKSKDVILEIKQKRAEKLLNGTISTQGADASKRFIKLLSENLRDRLLRSGSALEDVNDFVEIKVSTVMDLLSDYAKLENNRENRELLINEVADNLGLSTQNKTASEILKEIGDEMIGLMHIERMEDNIGQYIRAKDLIARNERKFDLRKNLNKRENLHNSYISTQKLKYLIDSSYSCKEISGISDNLFKLRSLPSLIKGPINHSQVQFIASVFTNLITEGKSEIYEKKGAISAIDAIHQKVVKAVIQQEEKAANEQGVEGNKWTGIIEEQRLSMNRSQAHLP